MHRHGSDDEPSVLTGKTTVLRATSEEEKIKAEGGVAKGSWLCPAAGSIRVRFDNTYSVLRSKTISYLFEVCPPDDLAGGVAELTIS